MHYKRATWTSPMIAALMITALFFGPTTWAAEPQSQEVTLSTEFEVLDWLWQSLSAAWSTIYGSEGIEGSEVSEVQEPTPPETPAEEPPTAEVGPGMVPIG